MITPYQCRAARALIDWSQQTLADASKVGNATIRNFEGGKSNPTNATLDVLSRTLESAGVEFIEFGVRLRELRIGDRVRYPVDEGATLFHAGHVGDTGTVIEIEGRPTKTIRGGQVLVRFTNGETHWESAELLEFVPD